VNIYIVETFVQQVDRTLKSVSMGITDDLEWHIETDVEAHNLGKVVQQSKGQVSGIILFERGRIEYKLKK
jgi:hypothetical protein